MAGLGAVASPLHLPVTALFAQVPVFGLNRGAAVWLPLRVHEIGFPDRLRSRCLPTRDAQRGGRGSHRAGQIDEGPQLLHVPDAN